jgi:hypothetical protein
LRVSYGGYYQLEENRLVLVVKPVWVESWNVLKVSGSHSHFPVTRLCDQLSGTEGGKMGSFCGYATVSMTEAPRRQLFIPHFRNVIPAENYGHVVLATALQSQINQTATTVGSRARNS